MPDMPGSNLSAEVVSRRSKRRARPTRKATKLAKPPAHITEAHFHRAASDATIDHSVSGVFLVPTPAPGTLAGASWAENEEIFATKREGNRAVVSKGQEAGMSMRTARTSHTQHQTRAGPCRRAIHRRAKAAIATPDPRPDASRMARKRFSTALTASHFLFKQRLQIPDLLIGEIGRFAKMRHQLSGCAPKNTPQESGAFRAHARVSRDPRDVGVRSIAPVDP
jgi:hypothetical protein